MQQRHLTNNQAEVIPIENGEILCVTPLAAQATIETFIDPDRDCLMEMLRECGAILFRGYPVGSEADFASFCRALNPQLLNYAGGTSPRLQVMSNIYTSTEYPNNLRIAMHNEMSYSADYPDFIFFYCAVAPVVGGETPIADSRKVLSQLPDAVVREFEERRVGYVRQMIDSDGSMGSWQRIFETSNRRQVEALCQSQGLAWRWDEYGSLRTVEARPAVRTHARTGEKVWFNQAHMWHVSNVADELDLADIDEDDLAMNATFADGGKISMAALHTIREAFSKCSMQFQWQEGDVLMLDNVLMAHGRAPFSGKRKILVAMGKEN